MGLNDLTLVQWVGSVVAALLVGLSKAGFGTGAGILAVPLMAAVLEPSTALPVMLLVLITGDVFSLVHYKRDHDRRALLMLVPGLVLGVIAGALALRWFQALPTGQIWLKRLIGLLTIAFVGIQCLRAAQERRLGVAAAPYRPRVWHGVTIGAGAGVTSTLAHAGGPLIALFLLPQRLPKKALVGTMIKYFFTGNLIKLVAYCVTGVLVIGNVPLALVLVPAVAAGTVLGISLQGRFSDRAFRTAVYTLALLAGLYLLIEAREGEGGKAPKRTPEQSATVQPLDAFHEGLEAFGHSDWASAEGAFGRALAQAGPWADAARFNRALALYRAGRFGAAREQFGLLTGSADGVVAASAGLNAGNCAYCSTHWDEAAGLYARAVRACRDALSGTAGARADGRDALLDIRARAQFNLALARRRADQPDRAGPARGAGTSENARRGRPDGAGANAVGGPREAVTRPGAGHEPGQGDGQRELAALMAYVTVRDTGPVVASHGAPAMLDGRNW